jgi:predicted esterase
MNQSWLILWLLGVCTLSARSAGVATSTPPAGFDDDISFRQSAPYSAGPEVLRRFGIPGVAPAYDLTREKFRLTVPETYLTNTMWGLFVWISPSDEPRIPEGWKAQFARHETLFIGAYKGGNTRGTVDRMRLALDAAFNIRLRYRIDPRRVYVSGFSGGGRVASMLGVSYADIFPGTFAVCGANFYTTVPSAPGKFYNASYVPDPRMLPFAKRTARYVLLTGEKDMNRENTQTVCTNGFKRNGFANVNYVEVPGMSHAVPSADELGRALGYLSGLNTNRLYAPAQR